MVASALAYPAEGHDMVHLRKQQAELEVVLLVP